MKTKMIYYQYTINFKFIMACLLSLLDDIYLNHIIKLLPLSDLRRLKLTNKYNSLISITKQEDVFYKDSLVPRNTLMGYTYEIMFEGYLHLLPDRYKCLENRTLYENNRIVYQNAKMGRFDIITFLLKYNPYAISQILMGFGEVGNIEGLEWLKSNYNIHKLKVYVTYELNYNAGNNDDRKLLLWLRDNNFIDKGEASNAAARNHNLDLLKWLKDNNFCIGKNVHSHSLRESKVSEWIKLNASPNECSFLRAVRMGNLDILCWLKNQNCPHNDEIFYEAGKKGDIKILKWLESNGYGKSYRAYYGAISSNNLELIKWLYEGGYSPIETIENAVYHGRKEIFTWLLSKNIHFDRINVVISAISSKNIGMLEFIYENNFKPTRYCLKLAAGFDDLSVLNWLYGIYPKYRCWDFNNTIFVHTTKIIEWFYVRKLLILNEKLFTQSVLHLPFEIIFWLKNHGCPYNEMTFESCVRNQISLDRFKLLNKFNCPWNDKTFIYSRYLPRETRKWLKDNGYPV
jgi:hypothetical protein